MNRPNSLLVRFSFSMAILCVTVYLLDLSFHRHSFQPISYVRQNFNSCFAYASYVEYLLSLWLLSSVVIGYGYSY